MPFASVLGNKVFSAPQSIRIGFCIHTRVTSNHSSCRRTVPQNQESNKTKVRVGTTHISMAAIEATRIRSSLPIRSEKDDCAIAGYSQYAIPKIRPRPNCRRKLTDADQIAILSSLVARKATFLLALILIASPVAGLRPMRAARLRTCRMPSPAIFTRSPFFKCLVIIDQVVQHLLTARLLRWCCSASAATKSVLLNGLLASGFAAAAAVVSMGSPSCAACALGLAL